MKAFNLEEAKAGKPICTRDGVVVEFIAHVPGAVYNNRVIVLHQQSGMLLTTTEEGHYYVNTSKDGRDLFMQSTKRTVWVNLYKDGTCSIQYREEHIANMYGKYEMRIDRIGDKAYPIEIED